MRGLIANAAGAAHATALAAALAGCAPVLPSEPVERALTRDLAHIVEVKQRVGWLVDDVEVQAALPDAMKSACRVGDVHRSAAAAWLDGEIARLGGPVPEAWRRNDKRLDELDHLLLAARTRLLLDRADGWVRAGKCPFWLEPTDEFDGVQGFHNRLVLALETEGRFGLDSTDGTAGAVAGGAGRLLFGYGIAETVTLFAGLESGGGGHFVLRELERRVDLPSVVAVTAVPILLRWHFGLSTHADLEAAPIAYILWGKDEAFSQLKAHPGVRLGLAVGGSYLRLSRGVLPTFTFAVLGEHVPAGADNARVDQIIFAVRAGFNFSR